jgi:aminoglycoside phosphotransferase (APT) family kinase protein
MRELAHGYTNRTLGDGGIVSKTYQGPDAAERRDRERRTLERLRGLLPVPEIDDAADVAPLELRLRFLAGEHGQELIERGYADEVLHACGLLLRRLRQLPAGEPGRVLVHGDFGPNNLLLSVPGFAVTGLLDWEFAHIGDPIEDLAWCEWIVRAHHPDRRDALGSFFAAYRFAVPPWAQRQAFMLDRCAQLREFCRRWDSPDGVRQWERRAEAVALWTQ